MKDYRQYLWDPHVYEEAFAFYKAKHSMYLEDHLKNLFTRNYGKMKVRPTAITKRLIESMSSVYKSTVNREFSGDIKPRDIAYIKKCLVKFEQHLNTFGVACIYSSLNNNSQLQLKVIPASRFTVTLDIDGNITSVLLRQSDEVWLKWIDGKIYRLESEKAPLSDSDGIGSQVGVYDNLPFFIRFEDEDYPSTSLTPFIAIEKDIVAYKSLNRMSAAIAILKLLVAPSATDDDVAHISKIVGNMTGVIGLPNTVQGLSAIDMGDIANNINFDKLNNDELRMICVQNGADYTSIDVDENLESGKAREMKLVYMNGVRDGKLSFYEEVEYDLWSWLNQLDAARFKELDNINFGSYDINLTKIEKVEVEGSQQLNDYNQVLRGVMDIEEYVRKYNESKDDSLIVKLVERVMERMI